jgi:hypothetical protein
VVVVLVHRLVQTVLLLQIVAVVAVAAMVVVPLMD